MSGENQTRLISKTAFLNGRQCRKRLWMEWHSPDDAGEGVEQVEVRFRKGRDIGAQARFCFPEGHDATAIPFDPGQAVENTRLLMDNQAGVIYQASFRSDGLFATVDMLVRKGNHWHAYEVKSGSSVKAHYLQDCAYQLYVLKAAGVPVSKFFILHLNNKYILGNEIEYRQLFHREPVLKSIQLMQNDIAVLLPGIRQIMHATEIPNVDIGPHCNSPYPCPFRQYCWTHIPQPSVFDIVHLGNERKFSLYYRGVYLQEHIPGDFQLSDAQQLQVRSTVTGAHHTDLERLREWMLGLRYPISFVDFECMQPAIPRYQGTKPYQQIPFQFSIHILSKPGNQARHLSFLADAGPDPRPAFVDALLKAIGVGGTVLAYNRDFEVARLKELSREFPERKDEIEEIISRIADLMVPFEKKWYYAPGMQGSHSIKNVLPALVPGSHYDALEIRDGQAAAEAYESLMYANEVADVDKTRADLEAYCNMDTEAMVQILHVLEQACNLASQ